MSIIVLTALLTIPSLLPRASSDFVAFPDWKGELLGAASSATLFGNNVENEIGTNNAPTTFNPARPPNVSPNTLVNGPQGLFPASLLGRSETTLAVSAEGNFLVAGFNDAEGFLRAPFFSGGLCSGGSPPAGCAKNPGLSGNAFSTDGGNTWTEIQSPYIPGSPDPNNPTCGNIVTRGDPWLDVGGSGNDIIFYANLAVHSNPSATPTCSLGDSGSGGVSVHRGHFTETSPGIFTFSWDDVHLLQAVPGVGLSVGYPLDFYDKEALAADHNGARPNVFVSVTNFVGRSNSTDNILGCGFGQIELWSSLDNGNTWSSSPTLVQGDQVSPTTCRTGRLNQGSQPAVGPDGTVYVAWQNGPDFVAVPGGSATVLPLSVSIKVANCGIAAAGPCSSSTVDNINSMRLSAPQGYNRNRLQDFPRIAVAQTGPHAGRVYVVYASGTGTPICFVSAPGCIPTVYPDSNILLKFSDDGGTSWSTPINVNPPNDGRKDFWPVVSVDRDGNVDIVWVSSAETNVTPSLTDTECTPGAKQSGGGPSQNGKRSSLVDVFWAQSLDGGNTFETPVKVTSVTSNWCKARTNVRPTFGDYIDAHSFGNRVFVLWADGRQPAPAADSLAPPAGPRDRESDVFYSSIFAIGRAPR